jgi:hypothetical protein
VEDTCLRYEEPRRVLLFILQDLLQSCELVCPQFSGVTVWSVTVLLAYHDVA